MKVCERGTVSVKVVCKRRIKELKLGGTSHVRLYKALSPLGIVNSRAQKKMASNKPTFKGKPTTSPTRNDQVTSQFKTKAVALEMKGLVL